ESTTIKTSILAFMDDTLWIAKSWEDLDHIIHIADSFYQLNSIKVNWEKSVLLTNRNDNNNVFTCIINGTPTVIPPLSLNESTRYLGIWISLRPHIYIQYCSCSEDRI
ncbi:9430_t:CDS:2, partial [Funneliformis geosporum]